MHDDCGGHLRLGDFAIPVLLNLVAQPVDELIGEAEAFEGRPHLCCRVHPGWRATLLSVAAVKPEVTISATS